VKGVVVPVGVTYVNLERVGIWGRGRTGAVEGELSEGGCDGAEELGGGVVLVDGETPEVGGVGG
jgi:hypothetical protein